MTSNPTVFNVLSNYTALPREVQAKRWNSAGGFSGAEIWRIEAAGRSYCLRRWPPEHPDRERLTFIHSVLRTAAANGLDYLPVPLQTKSAATFTCVAGCFWELTPWLPGVAGFWSQPTPTRLTAALQALARFHEAVKPGGGQLGQAGPAPALLARRDRLVKLLAGELDDLAAALNRERIRPQLDMLVRESLPLVAPVAQRWIAMLQAASQQPLLLQPAIRDIWHDHVLFTGERVTGIVDFGAMRIDTPLTDVARLVGSLVADDAPRREQALAAYAAERALSDYDRQLVDLLDYSSVPISLANWVQWIYAERRAFDDLASIESRVSKLATRLQHLI